MTSDVPWVVKAPEPLGPVAPRERPTLSVIIPYYRRADVIRSTVESALDQTLAADEIVICDDGSPDDLEAALGPLRSRVRIVRKENGGFASAMNAAAAAAQGEFVVQLDSDDAFLPRRLEAIAHAASVRPDVDIIATDAILEYEGKPLARYGEAVPFQTDNQRTAIFRACFFAWPAIRRSFLLAVGGWDEEFRLVADWECFVRLILAGGRVALVDEPLYRYRLTRGSLMSDEVARWDGVIRVLAKTLAREDLDPPERSVAESTVAYARREKTFHEARHAILTGSPQARRAALAVALGHGFPPRRRVRAAAGAVLPALARKALLGSDARRDPVAVAFAQRTGVGLPRRDAVQTPGTR
jgi:hypothetical protein